MPLPAYILPGDTLKQRYEITRELGRGGYSVVYLARDRELDTEVAVKLLVPPPVAALTARERMRREVQAVRGLSHPNIVEVYDFLEEGPWTFVVMEYVAGPDLSVRVRERGPLDPESAIKLGRDIAAALTTAHRRGILHRDVKPQNILLDPDGRARLTDFGSAQLEGQTGVTATGGLAGTLSYTAPEVLQGKRGDARADIYALGLTLYYALTGELPGRPAAQLPPTPAAGGFRPRSAGARSPDRLDDVIARATAAAPEDRYPSAIELGEALTEPTGGDRFVSRAPHEERCPLCGSPEPLGLPICAACGGAAAAADTLIYLERAMGPSERDRAGARLIELFGSGITDSARRAAVRGERPLLRVDSAAVARVLERMAEHDLPAHPIPARRAWSAVPFPFYLLVMSVLVVGGAAGTTGIPLLLWTSPIVAGLMLAGAHRDAARPLLAARSRASALPPEVERRLLVTLAELPKGAARGLLADLSRMSAGLFGALARDGDEAGVGAQLSALLLAACGAAADLAQLDENLSRFERGRDRLHAPGKAWLDAMAECERTRDALVQRLLDAMTVVGQLRRQSAELADSAGPRLAELVAELEGEVRVRTEAARELEKVLRSA